MRGVVSSFVPKSAADLPSLSQTVVVIPWLVGSLAGVVLLSLLVKEQVRFGLIVRCDTISSLIS